jgi:hypothetical protein
VRGLALVPDIGFASCANDRFVFNRFGLPVCSSSLLLLQRDSSLDDRWRCHLYIVRSYVIHLFIVRAPHWRDCFSGRGSHGPGLARYVPFSSLLGTEVNSFFFLDGECAQTIVHPAISVWAVSSMPNGDIVSGTSDGVVRVFSNTEERWASEGEIKAYEDQVSSQTLNKCAPCSRPVSLAC